VKTPPGQPGAAFGRALLVVLLAVFVLPATADMPKVHGFQMDDYGIRVVEEAGVATLQLTYKSRLTSGYVAFQDPDTLELTDAARLQGEENLARFRVEVLEPASPNYVKNPGKNYRITVEGIEVAPDYKRIFEVDAYDALDAIQVEMRKIYDTTFGIRRAALIFGTEIAIAVLNESQYLPARIPLTVLRSNAGLFRIQGQTLSRGKIQTIDRFYDASVGQDVNKLLQAQADLINPDLEALSGPRYRRGQLQTSGAGEENRSIPYQTRRGRRPFTYQSEQLRGLNEPENRRDTLGGSIDALTTPDYDLPPVEQAVRENLRLRGGYRGEFEREIE
jgi:hypothetical protein